MEGRIGTRVPVLEHYNLRSANSYIGGSLHDLNANDISVGAGGVGDVVDRGGGGDDVTDDSLDDDEDSAAVVSVSPIQNFSGFFL